MPTGQLDEALCLHKKIAGRFKEYETTDGEFPPPVVLNEMRYALRASVKLLRIASFEHLSESEAKEYGISTQEFSHALRNAYHDLVDGILIQISRIMDSLLEQYPVAAANVLASKRLEILNDIGTIEKSIAKSRGNPNERQRIYDEEIYDQWFTQIVGHYNYVDHSIPEIIKEHDRLEKKDTDDQRKHLINVILGALAIAVTVALGLAAL